MKKSSFTSHQIPIQSFNKCKMPSFDNQTKQKITISPENLIRVAPRILMKKELSNDNSERSSLSRSIE